MSDKPSHICNIRWSESDELIKPIAELLHDSSQTMRTVDQMSFEVCVVYLVSERTFGVMYDHLFFKPASH